MPAPGIGLQKPRRRRATKLQPLQVAGLLLLLTLCVSYVYFVSHSPQLSQVGANLVAGCVPCRHTGAASAGLRHC